MAYVTFQIVWNLVLGGAIVLAWITIYRQREYVRKMPDSLLCLCGLGTALGLALYFVMWLQTYDSLMRALG